MGSADEPVGAYGAYVDPERVERLRDRNSPYGREGVRPSQADPEGGGVRRDPYDRDHRDPYASSYPRGYDPYGRHYDESYRDPYRDPYAGHYPPPPPGGAFDPHYDPYMRHHYPPPGAYGGGYYPPPGYGYGPPPPGYGHPPPHGYPPPPGYGHRDGYPPHGYPPPSGYGLPPPGYGHYPPHPDHGPPPSGDLRSSGRKGSGKGGSGKGGKGQKNKDRSEQGRKNQGNNDQKKGNKRKRDANHSSDEDEDVIDPADIRLTMDEVLPRLVEAATEQEGSRFLQWKLMKDCSPEERQDIFDAALPATAKLATDVFGNFVVQKLLATGIDDQKTAMLAKIKGSAMDLATDKYGCRVVQRAMKTLPPEGKVELALELSPNIIECIEDMHGNHVIQKVAKHMGGLSEIDFVIEPLAKEAQRMAEHMYGCRVIQRLVENCGLDTLAVLLDPIVRSAGKLSKDKHGNYVVQCILDHGREVDKRMIIEVVRGSLLEFAKNKVSSNVVEKCFAIATVGEHAEQLKEDRAALMRTVLGEKGDSKAPLAQLMEDKFGNYTVQCIIENSRGEDWKELCERITAKEFELGSSPTGRHILAKLEKKKAEMGES